MTTFIDPYASSRETTEGTVFSVTGGDWNELVTEIGATKEERIVVNMLSLIHISEPTRPY